MPYAPPSRCTCGAIATRRGRCDEHQVKAWANISARNRKLDRARWGKVAANYLRRHPQCARCRQPAAEVDHVLPISRGGALYDDANLQSLCVPHHAEKTKAEDAARRSRKITPVYG